LDDYAEDYTYLRRRGIAKNVARMFRVKYDIGRSAIVIPWFMPDGRLGNIKYRSTRSKAFWYAKGGRPIREMVFGLDVVYRRNIKRAAIVEAEIDVMSLWSCGIPAIATGGAAFSAAKRDLIVRSPIEELVIVRDNDEAGRKWQREVVQSLRPYLSLRLARMGRYKDVNDAHIAEGCGFVRKQALRSRKIKNFSSKPCALGKFNRVLQ
jgi:DNA primase